MKIAEAQRERASRRLSSAEIRRNPAKSSDWFAMLRGADGKTYMLVDEAENPVCRPSVDALLALLSDIGFNEASVYF